ncbi:hypothetical protein CWI39_0201p0010 [Hamiltosporidium magnivora]|uniref:Uncharacterized protein n=1 Tax=Hamiltosporidium magnivora TaxID=148818 RepID=A0A4Q9LM79_9MICR|nr:hypothetical protein CWI39_0201p0010 [Hamiltosporidium magnivora]
MINVSNNILRAFQNELNTTYYDQDYKTLFLVVSKGFNSTNVLNNHKKPTNTLYTKTSIMVNFISLSGLTT